MDNNSNLLGCIYDAALDPELWPEVLGHLGQMVGCRAGAFMHGTREPVLLTFMATTGLESSITDRAQEIFGNPDNNPILRKLPALTPGWPIPRQIMIDDETFLRHPAYLEFFRPQGLFHDITTPIALSPDETVGMFFGRSRSDGPLGESELRLLLPWIPHLQRALRIDSELRKHRAGNFASDELLDRIACGVLLVRSDGGIVVMNEAAERIVWAADGLALGNGRLVAQCNGDSERLRDAIAIAATGKGGDSLLVRRPSGARPYPVFTVPLPRTVAVNRFRAPAAAVLFKDPDSDMEQPAVAVAALYGLSPAETAVALEIAKGLGVDAVAATLGIGKYTVKTHLSHVFQKTGTNRQAELARLLANSSILRDDAGE